MTRIEIGLKASAEQFGPRELVEIAVEAEQHGFDSVTVSDHFQPWRHTGGHAPFALAWMAAVGERTSRIRIGTSVLTPSFRYNPAVLAQAFATLGCLYPGRIMLGVGTGEALNEVASGWRGDWPAFRERFARLRESVDLMRRLWTDDRITIDGEFYTTRNATIYDRPDSPVPIYIAAGGPVVAAYAGRAGDGFICTSGKGMGLYTEQLLPAVDTGLAKAGRDAASIDRMIEIKVSYDTDPDLARQNTRFWAPLSLSKEQKHDLSDPLEMERAADGLSMDAIASRWIVGSDPRPVAAAISAYIDAGFTHLVFHAPGADQRRFMTQFTRDVVPLLPLGR
ncbi:coenzyme F420-dependent glucose-6-phosphate dehydrogenase [Microbacterium sp. AG1240]|uniref:glucose-6-phosphate dehydrogenase (coenzyme-F420) n=1 Tax=Microbacterium sp. AG1240 TaxID=2183992 RepID=UPI000EAC1EE5|nr:glucose-6-phosphate dehydrogenase (coenzyme-F420) [Microbacterium sp. AG1240]RKT31473.1 coenzyme F420-dependent glucose-6-phosphate dehydrogenase [Microbacterium sp. AG1240]